MTTTDEVIEVNGVEIAYGTFGESEDPAIVLLHGAGNSMLSWSEDFCERLASGGRFVVRCDSRDAGRSTTYKPGAPPYSSADVVADTAALIDALGIAPAHVMGLSGGGVTAQLLALDHPDRVASLVLASTTPGLPGTDDFDLPGPDDRVSAPSATARSRLVRPRRGRRVPGGDGAPVRRLGQLRRGGSARAVPARRRAHHRHRRADDEPVQGRVRSVAPAARRDHASRRSWSTATTTRCSRSTTAGRSRARSPAPSCWSWRASATSTRRDARGTSFVPAILRHTSR